MTLIELAKDKILLKDLERLIYDHLDDLALNRVYNKEEVVGIPEARLIVEKAIDQLEQLVDNKEKKQPINIAR